MIVLRRADQRHIAVALQQGDKRVEIVLRRYGIQDEIEAVSVLRHLIRIFRDHDFIRAQALAVFDFRRRGGEQHHMRAHRVRNFHAHMAQSAQADDTDFFPRTDVPVAQRRIGGDASAQQRRDARQIQIFRHAQHEVFIDDHRR